MYRINGTVEQFPGKGGWQHLRVSRKYTDGLPKIQGWRFVKIHATVGRTTWRTSLLPYGDGSNFIALKASIRKAENIKVGDKIKLSYKLLLD